MKDSIRIPIIIFLILLLLLFALQAIGGLWNNAATYDEVAHLPAGYAYITEGDYRFNPEHPPLMKIISAAPLLFMNAPAVSSDPYWNSKNEWQFGRHFLYGSGLDADRALFCGRLPIVLLGLLLGIVIFLWSKELYGAKAALFSVALFAFEPNLIAHSGVIHTDLGASCFMVLSLYLFWKAISSPSRKRFIAAGFVTGLALATKFTAILIFPIMLILLLFYFLEEDGRIRLSRLAPSEDERLKMKIRLYFAFFSFLLLFLTAVVTLAASYGFFSIDKYWNGLHFLKHHNATGNPAFLLGMYSDRGWWYYFPLAFMMKSPIPIIIVFFAALDSFIISCFQKRGFSHYGAGKTSIASSAAGAQQNGRFNNCFNELFLLAPVLIIMVSSLFSHINIGVRHILPFYPFMMILAGRLAARAGRGMNIFLVILCVWLAASAAFIFPHHISYFNELSGGPANGYRHLVDSNYDWGQDLIRLKQFLQEEGEDSVILSYFGSADPNYYGIKYQYLPGYGLDRPQKYTIGYRKKEFIALSATNLQSVFFNTRDTFDWLKKKEPYARAGYSIFIWEISRDLDAHRNLARLYREFGMDDLAAKHAAEAEKITPSAE